MNDLAEFEREMAAHTEAAEQKESKRQKLMPMRTEADEIAFAAPRGYNGHVREMFQFKWDGHDDGDICVYCNKDEPYDWRGQKYEQRRVMKVFEVEWDPTIRL